MSGFGFKVSNGVASRIPVEEAPDASGDLVWVHLSTNEEEAQAWLRDEAKL